MAVKSFVISCRFFAMYASALNLRCSVLLRPLLCLVIMLSLAYGRLLAASEVIGLYDAEAPVTGVEAAERKAAIREAFAKVLIKVTGNTGVASRSSLAADLDNAARYVQQYRYESLPEGKQGDQVERLLKVSFDRAEIDRLLQSRGLPNWSANRPSVLIWVGEESRGKRRLLIPDLDTDLRQATDRVAAERGLPLLLPLMDLEDQGQLQVADIWGNFETNIRAASRRYAPDLILVGRLQTVSANLSRGEWQLYSSGTQSDSWNNQRSSRDDAIADALRQTADILASRFAPLRDERSLSTVRLRVAGITTLAGYGAVLDLLGTQNSLERVVVASVEQNAVVFDLHGQGGAAAVIRGLDIGGLLEPDPTAAGQPVGSAIPVDLYYRMR